ncbi:MAG: hypothetical protein JNL70_22175 [Saprospiraceae bacterium]|nr:hypothetical protein [Saprospiraceae bacterium]
MKNYAYKLCKEKGYWHVIVGILLINTTVLEAQINAFVGYAYVQNTDNKIFNGIIERYNANNPTLLQPMATLKYLHGVDLGIRYRIPSVSFEFNWINKFNNINDRKMATDNTEYRNVIYYKSQTFCLGLEFYHEWFGIGSSIDWNKLILRKEKSSDRIKETWLSQGGLSNHTFLNFEINMNDAMAFSIRPFVQLPLYQNDFYPVETKLNPHLVGSVDPNDYKQKIVNWGIKLLFVNGTKSR